MAYPTKYTRQYDYAAYQNANPARPLPAGQVHADLNFVASSLAETIDFIKTAIRSDGEVANGAIGWDQLSLSVQAITGDPTAVEEIIAAASASADAAATSASSASTSANSASTSAGSALTSATDAATSASAASTSATDAAASATDAAASATDAAATLAAAITGPGSAVDNAAVRFDTTTGKLAQNSALLIADTTGSLSRNGGGGIPVQGTNTNDNAAAGYIGEEIRRAVASGSAVSLTTGTPANVNYVDLTAGDWIVGGNVVFLAGVGMISTEYHVCTDPLTATVSSDESAHAFHTTFTTSQSAIIPVGGKRYSLAAPARIYMNCTQTFSGGTLSAYGTMWARRMR